MQFKWMIYGAETVSGKQLINEALRLGYKPYLAGSHGQDIADLSFQTMLPAHIFTLDDQLKIESLISGIDFIIVCKELKNREHNRLLKACLKIGINYCDLSADLFSYERVKKFSSLFEKKKLSLLPGFHRSVVVGDLVAAHLKRNFTNAEKLIIALSDSCSSFTAIVDVLLSGGRVIRNNKLRRPRSAAQSLLVPFKNKASLTVTSPLGTLLSSWISTRIPNIKIFRNSAAVEIRFLRLFRFFRWFLNIPFVANWLIKQESFFIKYFSIRPLYVKRLSAWGRASTKSGKSMTLAIEVNKDVDLGQILAFQAIESLKTGQIKPGIVTPSQLRDLEYWTDKERCVSLLITN